jgi:hypothetical protein
MGVGGQRHAPATLPPGKRTGTHCAGAGWAPGPVWTGAGNLSPTGIRSPDHPDRSESLYRLRYPGPYSLQGLIKLVDVSTRKFTLPVERSILEVGRGSRFGLGCTQVWRHVHV